MHVQCTGGHRETIAINRAPCRARRRRRRAPSMSSATCTITLNIPIDNISDILNQFRSAELLGSEAAGRGPHLLSGLSAPVHTTLVSLTPKKGNVAKRKVNVTSKETEGRHG